MTEVTFTVEGFDGEFKADADMFDRAHIYTTTKHLSMIGERPVQAYLALERVFMGRDEEYLERVGGIDGLDPLITAAVTACAKGVDAKNSSASSDATNSTATK